MEAMLQQQRAGSGAPLRTLMLLALPAALGVAALRYFGLTWAQIGWATPADLRAGLAAVQEAVGACVTQLGESLHARFATLEIKLEETAQGVSEVRAEVHAVGEHVSSLEARMQPIETDVHRTAQGVNLLCEVVAGLSPNASPELKHRLDTFTGTSSSRPASPDALTDAGRPELLPPPSEATLTTTLSSSAPPGFVARALLEGHAPRLAASG